MKSALQSWQALLSDHITDVVTRGDWHDQIAAATIPENDKRTVWRICHKLISEYNFLANIYGGDTEENTMYVAGNLRSLLDRYIAERTISEFYVHSVNREGVIEIKFKVLGEAFSLKFPNDSTTCIERFRNERVGN